jgi:hypothetical protein
VAIAAIAIYVVVGTLASVDQRLSRKANPSGRHHFISEMCTGWVRLLSSVPVKRSDQKTLAGLYAKFRKSIKTG